ncbi:CRISPR-associated Csy2 family protein [Bisgaardia hudsonensis]|uniref:CRISPR-associated Csy2 family protein n=1 Tax=Bisgaardia hudsonensis TaxID=109472 RepID=A0A4R2MWL3_9PAST|nr:type I-F CRISPR-associated protein Csy2 [Bisgaardia hudsonensis]TCP11457.1 CRISPR-associated Csy2 family protein [Bisgaardia hudsonensis]
MSTPNYYLLFDHIKVQSANAISSPITYGFPAISGFVGAIHALSRKLSHKNVKLDGVMIACHNYQIQTHQNSTYSDRTFNQTRNPLKKNGDTASIIEEGKIHLDISLVVEMYVDDEDLDFSLKHIKDDNQKSAVDFLEECKELLWQQRVAGGSIIDIEKVHIFNRSEEEQIPFALVPAFVLVDAREKLSELTQQLQKGISINETEIIPPNDDITTLDVLLETATIHHIPNSPNALANEWETFSIKQGQGWLVPIPIGYQGISPIFKAGEMKNCRTSEYPSQYVETIYSLGKWVFPFNLTSNINEYFWRYTQPDNNLYLFSQGEK